MKQIGVALYNDFRGSIESFFNFLQKLGVDYVEIGKEWIPSSSEVSVMRDLLDIYELRANLHISYQYNMIETDERKWKRNLLGVLGDLSICYDLNIENAVLHCGWIARDDNTPHKLQEDFIRFSEAYNIIYDFSRDFGVNVGLENQSSIGGQHNIFLESQASSEIKSISEGWEQYLFQKSDDVDTLSEIIGEDILFVLDVGHLGVSHGSLEDMVKRMGDNLLGIHIHDYDNCGRDHLPLGTGKLDMDNLFSLIRDKDLFITLENRSTPNIKYSILHSPLARLCHPINKI